MNLLNFFTKTYGLLQNYGILPYWVLTPFRRLIRSLSKTILPIYLKYSKTKCIDKVADVIVSFTSFPARIEEVWQVVECMLRQTVRPQKIILWLSAEQFPSPSLIPDSLRSRMNDIFEIRIVEGDLKSHKKYYYVSKEYPESLILLIDDDIYYPTDMLDNLMRHYEESTASIVCQYGYLINYDENSRIKPYREWEFLGRASYSDRLFFGSGGGTLLKPSSLYNDLTNLELFTELTPTADDIWLNAMARLNYLPIMMLTPKLILPVYNKKDKQALCDENVLGGKNDIQIEAVRTHYINKFGIDPFDINYSPIYR